MRSDHIPPAGATVAARGSRFPSAPEAPIGRSVNARAIPASSWTSALIAALVGFGGTVALIVQAVQAMGGTPHQVASAVTALCVGIAVTGAALGRLAARIPASVASAMLAGVLLPFCLALFRTLESDVVLAGVLILVFIAARQRFPLYALLIVLGVAVALVFARGDVAGMPAGTLFGTLAPTAPEFSSRAIIGIGIPLFLVTLVSQNLPGLVVLRSSGYAPPPQPLLLFTGLTTLLLAPFGAYSVNLSAITAAICTGADAHPDPARRWTVGLFYAGFYLLLALFSAPLVSLFLAMPMTTIAAITGIALIGPLAAALGNMMTAAEDREAAILTFAATASGMSLFGIGSAFWGLVVGFTAIAARAWLARPKVMM